MWTLCNNAFGREVLKWNLHFCRKKSGKLKKNNRMGNMTILSDFVFSSDLCLRETKIYNLFQRNCTGFDIYKNTSEYWEEKRKRATLLLLLHYTRYFISNSLLCFLCELFVVWVLEKLWKCIFGNRLCSI